jgi:hypothetical protein
LIDRSEEADQGGELDMRLIWERIGVGITERDIREREREREREDQHSAIRHSAFSRQKWRNVLDEMFNLYWLNMNWNTCDISIIIYYNIHKDC